MRNGKMSITEATIQALQESSSIKDLYNQLDNDIDTNDIEGLMDGIIVVTDPEVDSEQYNELLNRANELVEGTPEGDIPINEDYIGQYVQMCPVCGTPFIAQEMLEPGSACPICQEMPERFIMLGQLSAEETVQKEMDLEDGITSKEPQEDEEPEPFDADIRPEDEEEPQEDEEI